jgi:hypothetical protein
MSTTKTLNDWPEARELLKAPALPELGPGPRAGVESPSELQAKLATFFKGTPLPAGRQELVRSAIYLWHDHMDASHEISQSIETPDGSLLHGILHRREPDYWNSKYWLRRVGQHPAYPVIGQRVAARLAETGDADLASKLAPGGRWDPMAFVDQCEQAARASTPPTRNERLREIQQIEFEAVLEYLLGGAGGR